MGKYQIETDNGTFEIETEDSTQNSDLVSIPPKTIEPTFASELAGGQDSIVGNIGQWGKDIALAPVNALDAATNLAAKVVGKTINNPMLSSLGPIGAGIAGVETLYEGTQGKDVRSTAQNIFQRTGDLAVGSLPVVGPALQTGFDYLANVGLDTEKTGAEYGKQLREGLAQAPFQAIISKASSNVDNPITKIKNKILGKSREDLLAEQSYNKDIYANKLDYGSRVTAQERHIIANAEDASDAFTRTNPVAGVDPSGGRRSFEQFQQNLINIENKAVLDRNAILPKVAEAESKLAADATANGTIVKTGIDIKDIPTSIETPKGPYGLDNIRIKYGDAPVEMARKFVEEQFDIIPTKPYGEHGPTYMAEGRPLSAQEANIARMKIDSTIRDLGGFDDSYWINQKMNPSVGEGYAEALRFYRQQLDGAIKQHISDVLGPEAAKRFTEAGEEISMAKTYGPMAERFKRDTGQAYTPGSAKKVPPGSGPLGTSGIANRLLSSFAPDIANRKMQTVALQREGNAIADLQYLIELKNNNFQKPISRNWALIKSNAQDLKMVATIAANMGLIKAPEQLAQMPEPLAERVVGQVAQQNQQLFEQNPHGVNVINGKLQSGYDADVIKAQSLDLSPEERYKYIGSSFENKYPDGTISTPIPQSSYEVPALSELNSMLTTVPSPTYYESEATDMVTQLEKMTAIHERDYQ